MEFEAAILVGHKMPLEIANIHFENDKSANTQTIIGYVAFSLSSIFVLIGTAKQNSLYLNKR